jgi:hypothetical protein
VGSQIEQAPAFGSRRQPRQGRGDVADARRAWGGIAMPARLDGELGHVGRGEPVSLQGPADVAAGVVEGLGVGVRVRGLVVAGNHHRRPVGKRTGGKRVGGVGAQRAGGKRFGGAGGGGQREEQSDRQQGRGGTHASYL